jgi:hypothetical protein
MGNVNRGTGKGGAFGAGPLVHGHMGKVGARPPDS